MQVIIKLPEDLVKEIDKRAGIDYCNRTEYIRDAILRKMRAKDQWQTIFDLSDLPYTGAKLRDVLEDLWHRKKKRS